MKLRIKFSEGFINLRNKAAFERTDENGGFRLMQPSYDVEVVYVKFHWFLLVMRPEPYYNAKGSSDYWRPIFSDSFSLDFQNCMCDINWEEPLSAGVQSVKMAALFYGNIRKIFISYSFLDWFRGKFFLCQDGSYCYSRLVAPEVDWQRQDEHFKWAVNGIVELNNRIDRRIVERMNDLYGTNFSLIRPMPENRVADNFMCENPGY